MSKESKEQELAAKAQEVLNTVHAQHIELDDEDKLKLQNMVLVEQNAALRQQLLERELTEGRKRFYEAVTQKYNIDTVKFNIEISPSTGRISLVNK